MEGLSNSNGCKCYVDREDMRAAMQVDFPKQCLQDCKRQFLQSVRAKWTEEAGWPEGCQDLTSKSAAASAAMRFWSLYWCDMEFCGVAINQTGGLEQDRELFSSSERGPGREASRG
jgi:hypothetical protein